MIVVGLDVHKQSVTVVAVDEAGRPLAEKTIVVGSDELLGWAVGIGAERLWAVEDCRQLTRWLERQLLGVGEELVRVPPKLTVPERRAGRTRGKSDPIDALAIARAALREPDLSRPRPGEQVFRDLKLLVDHRDDLVDARRRTLAESVRRVLQRPPEARATRNGKLQQPLRSTAPARRLAARVQPLPTPPIPELPNPHRIRPPLPDGKPTRTLITTGPKNGVRSRVGGG